MKKVLSQVYSFLTSTRNFMYNRKIFSSYSVGVPVVSVGNLCVGGSGKTPFIDYLVRWAMDHNLNVAIVSRGYKRKSRGIKEVCFTHSNMAKEFGDEPTLLKLRHKNIPIWVGSDRFEVSKAILKKKSVDIILADDAFQHRRLGRNLDIVIVDATQGVKQFLVMPEGFSREDISNLSRADFIVINKVNLSDIESINRLKDQMRPYYKKDFILSDVVLESIDPIRKGFGKDLEFLDSKKSYIAISSIARPDTFKNLLFDNSYKNLIKHYSFKDHYSFSEKDLEDIDRSHPNIPWVITEKDAAKIRDFSEFQNDVFVAKIKLNIISGENALTNELLRVGGLN